ncbi:MAG: hypothetical protein J0I41_15700 [Filimonas sp.]|nr:hypothetical protein [Filimonas sp.]
MASPTTYAAWAAVLERFGNGDDTVYEAMNTGYFVLDAGTAQRFYLRVEEVYKKRKQNWLDKFQHSFRLQHIKTDDDFALALRNGKQNLLPLLKFVSAKGLPDDLKKALQKDLVDFVSEIKKSLKDNISKNSASGDSMLILLSGFWLPEIIDEKESAKKLSEESNNTITPTGRKIIF